jgi:hypothetical protein
MSGFDEWFEENQEELESLLRSDTTELLFRAWLAGYENGMSEMSSFAANTFSTLLMPK